MNLENSGTMNHLRDDDISLYEKLVSEVKFMEGRYQVQLLFRDRQDNELLPDN